MANGKILSPNELRKLLRYDPLTGKLYWLPRTPDMFNDCSQTRERRCKIWNSKFANKEAFTALENGRNFHGRIFNKAYKAHRVAWAIYTGSWPRDEIDHINHIPHDNRISNLREVSRAQNSKNMPRSKANNSGCTGVSWHKRAKKWRARIKFDKEIHLGLFDCFDDAVKARKKAEEEFGFHKNHGS